MCKGIYFKGYSSVYSKNGIITEKKELRLMKRISCSGCEVCSGIYEHIIEDISHNCLNIPNVIENGMIYIPYTFIDYDDYSVVKFKIKRENNK